jgi:hypothetical protein
VPGRAIIERQETIRERTGPGDCALDCNRHDEREAAGVIDEYLRPIARSVQRTSIRRVGHVTVRRRGVS